MAVSRSISEAINEAKGSAIYNEIGLLSSFNNFDIKYELKMQPYDKSVGAKITIENEMFNYKKSVFNGKIELNTFYNFNDIIMAGLKNLYTTIIRLAICDSCDGRKWDSVYFDEWPKSYCLKCGILTENEYRYILNDLIGMDTDAIYVARNKEDKKMNNRIESSKYEIDKIIFNGDATIVIFEDGEKVIVKRQKYDEMDREKAVAMAIMKRVYGTNRTRSNYIDKIKPLFDKASEAEAKREEKKNKPKTKYLVGDLDRSSTADGKDKEDEGKGN